MSQNGRMNKIFLYRDGQGYFVAQSDQGTLLATLMPGLAAEWLLNYKASNPDSLIVDTWDLPWHTRFLARAKNGQL